MCFLRLEAEAGIIRGHFDPRTEGERQRDRVMIGVGEEEEENDSLRFRMGGDDNGASGFVISSSVGFGCWHSLAVQCIQGMI